MNEVNGFGLLEEIAKEATEAVKKLQSADEPKEKAPEVTPEAVDPTTKQNS
jgi:hypothetical protein